jgi:hypothetical protein
VQKQTGRVGGRLQGSFSITKLAKESSRVGFSVVGQFEENFRGGFTLIDFWKYESSSS